MEDLKMRKLREKLGISAEDQREAASKAISPNLRQKIPGYPEFGRQFRLCAVRGRYRGGGKSSRVGRQFRLCAIRGRFGGGESPVLGACCSPLKLERLQEVSDY